jgi:putative protease
MPYELVSDSQLVPLGDRRYLLSPQDLAGLEVLPELVRAGVTSLKIEGRLKAPEYVASITRVYRQALDKIAAQQFSPIPQKDRYELEMSFSRGLFTGWFGGVDNQKLVHARFGKKRGVYLGEVKKIVRDGVIVNLAAPLKPGDGIVFDAGKPDEKEEGGRIYEMEEPRFKLPGQKLTELRFGNGQIDFLRVHVGDKLWKTDDPELDRQLRQTFEGDKIRYQRPIEMEVHGLVGKPLTLITRDAEGHVVKVESTMPLAKAEKVPLTEEKLRDQLGRLGGTPFKLGELKNFLSGEVMLPVSELNRLRRDAAAELEKLCATPKRWTLNSHRDAETQSLATVSTSEPLSLSGKSDPQLIVLVRSLPQLEAALKCGVRTLYCEFEDPKKYREAVRTFHESFSCSAFSLSSPTGGEGGGEEAKRIQSQNPSPQPSPRLGGARESSFAPNQPAIFVAPPRITKMGEEWILNQVRSCNADGYLVRNYDHLKFFADTRRIGDFSLNVANRLTADYFKNHFGLERVTASYDLNVLQLDSLLQAAPPEWFEITIHQHMPMFHMEHCVFCAFLSKGKDYHDCGRPCDTHDVRLRDRVGAEHPLKADAGCRNTVFNSQAQTGAEFVERLLTLGIRNFRVEFLNETPDEVVKTITKYRQLLRGEISGTQLWRELKLFNQLGVTRGQMAG